MTFMFSVFTLAIKFDYLFLTIFQSFYLCVSFVFDKLAPPLNIQDVPKVTQPQTLTKNIN